jgi:hypothetical protein
MSRRNCGTLPAFFIHTVLSVSENMSVFVLLVWKEDKISLLNSVNNMDLVANLNILLICGGCMSFVSGCELK